MNAYYFTFRSVTPAQRAQRDLEQAGIPAQLTRTPGPLAENGCGYALRVPVSRGAEAARALRGAGVQRLWLRRGGSYEEADRDLL